MPPKLTEDTKLTNQQENFAQKFVEYGVASKAYRESYNIKTELNATIWTSAYKVRVKPHVNKRIQQLIEQRRASVHIDREKITVDLLELVEKSKQTGLDGSKADASSLLKAYEMLNKMYDLNQDAKEDRHITKQNKQELLDNLKLRIKKDSSTDES